MPNWPDIVAQWAALETLHGLKEANVLSILESAGPLTAKELATKVHVAHAEVEAALEFLSLVLPELVERSEGEAYKLTSAYQHEYTQNSVNFTKAYAPVLHSLGDLLTGEKKYGNEITRNFEALATSSEIYIRDVMLDLVPLITQDDGQVLIDLGCGSGFIARRLREIFGMYAVGVDSAIPSAQEGEVLFIKGDIQHPQQWQHHIPHGRKVLIASMVLHELLKTEGVLQKFFESYKAAFPQSVLYVIEYSGRSFQELKQMDSDAMKLAAVYQYMHPLTKQGMPTNETTWKNIFAASGVQCSAVGYSKNNSLIFKLML